MINCEKNYYVSCFFVDCCLYVCWCIGCRLVVGKSCVVFESGKRYEVLGYLVVVVVG